MSAPSPNGKEDPPPHPPLLRDARVGLTLILFPMLSNGFSITTAAWR